MGGSKTKAKAPPKKKKATVPKLFKCPFCNHDGACEVKLDRTQETGTITCRICGESFQTRVSYISDPVDVYCEWIDELERARGGAAGGAGGPGASDAAGDAASGGRGGAAAGPAAASAGDDE